MPRALEKIAWTLARRSAPSLPFIRPVASSAARMSASVIREYQTSMSRISPKRHIHFRYDSMVLIVAARLADALKPLPRPATTTLAASRLTSHSHGPGSVSSKSFASKTNARSGEPKRPKFDR